MKRLIYRSMIPNDKPEWLLRLQMEISQKYSGEFEDSQCERMLHQVENEIREILFEMMDRRGGPRIASDITTKIVADDDRQVLHIIRNGKMIQYYCFM